MEADFDRFYGRDLGEIVFVEEWPPSKIWHRIIGLPDDSAFGRSLSGGHSRLHELLAQIRDATVTAAHGYRYQGKPSLYPRPGQDKAKGRTVDPTNPEDAAALRAFFGQAK